MLSARPAAAALASPRLSRHSPVALPARPAALAARSAPLRRSAALSRRCLRVAAAAGRKDDKQLDLKNLPGSQPDVWESEFVGGVFKNGFVVILVAAVVFVLALAAPVLSTMEATFPKA